MQRYTVEVAGATVNRLPFGSGCSTHSRCTNFMKLTLEQIEDILEEDFKDVRIQVQKAVDASPKSVKYEEALKQVNMVGSD